jgi:hypothetical protein
MLLPVLLILLNNSRLVYMVGSLNYIVSVPFHAFILAVARQPTGGWNIHSRHAVDAN